eukprot:Phypoly_transcript_16605.p1 GENE.Phypoly_transcript_16605~~Phypoly_transcript_16605.p1  ORF type:complete len:240 (+),score=56.90 Phypoly_transcript_16605:123-842(+)
MGLRPELYGIDEKAMFAWFNCKNEEFLKEFLAKLDAQFGSQGDSVDLEEMKELARLVFMDVEGMKKFESKHSPEHNRKIENHKVHIPLAVQLSFFKQEGIVETDSNYWNSGGYFDSLAQIPELEGEAEACLMAMSGWRGLFNNDDQQSTPWSYYGYLSHNDCITLRKKLAQYNEGYKAARAAQNTEKKEAKKGNTQVSKVSKDGNFAEQPKYIEEITECLLCWLEDIIQAKKMLFVYTQ